MTKLAGRSVGLQGRAYGDVFFFFFLGGGGGEVPYIDMHTYIYIYMYIYCLLTCLAAVCSYAVRSLIFASGVCRRGGGGGGVSIYIYIYAYMHVIYACTYIHACIHTYMLTEKQI